MESFERANLEHIKDIFQRETGVVLKKRTARRRVRTALMLAAVLACLTIGVAANQGLFSVLDGDDLALKAVYCGEGIVEIEVENRSNRDLAFQPQMKLTRWTTAEEVLPYGTSKFTNRVVPAHTTKLMTIDLSDSYDVEMLEQPLENDWYYLTLTNNHFCFGQDWICSVDFCERNTTTTGASSVDERKPAVPEQVQEELKTYFECSSLDPQDRRAAEEAYVKAYTDLLESFEGNIVSSTSPVLPGNRIDTEKPYLTLGRVEDSVIFDPKVPAELQQQLIGMNWFGRNSEFKLTATQGEYALVVSVILPSLRYKDAGHAIPLFYILTYDKRDISAESYAFVFGQVLSFDEMETYIVYEDEQYICCEVSELMYADPIAHAKQLAQQDTDIIWNEESEQRMEAIVRYYEREFYNLFMYR